MNNGYQDVFMELVFWCRRQIMNEYGFSSWQVHAEKENIVIAWGMMGVQRLCGSWSVEVTSEQRPNEVDSH